MFVVWIPPRRCLPLSGGGACRTACASHRLRGDERRGSGPVPQTQTASRLPGRRLSFDALLLLISGGSGEVAELLQVLFLLLVARRQLEQPGCGAAQDVVLRLFAQERQVVDRRGQVEVPVRVVRGV